MNLTKTTATITLIAASITGGLAITASTAQAVTTPPSTTQGVAPTRVDNATCPAGMTEFKIEPIVEPGGFDSYTNTDGVIVSIEVTEGNELRWLANVGIDVVIVKGGTPANVYVYDPEAFNDLGLYAPDNSPLSHLLYCYDLELVVTTSATTGFVRDWDWDIVKSVDPTTLNLHQGQTGSVQWTVAVTRTGPQDSGWVVNGLVSMNNQTPVDAAITGITDVISGIGSITVTCPEPFPFVIPGGDGTSCEYQSALPDATARTNTATVTTSGLVAGGTAAVVFDPNADPEGTVVETDASINVSDTVAGNLGAFTESGSTSYSTQYTCDQEGQHSNTATIPATSDEPAQSSTATTNVVCLASGGKKHVAKHLVGNFGKCISTLPVELKVESTPGHGPSGPGVFFFDPELGEVVDSPKGPLKAIGHAPFVRTMACGPDSR